MVEYGKSKPNQKKEKEILPSFFGITFGEVSHLDYEPEFKIKSTHRMIC